MIISQASSTLRSSPLPIFQDRIASEKAILHLKLSEFQVQSKLLSLDPGKSPGPDSIYPRVLKYCAHAIAVPLTILFKQSLKEGEVQTLWKHANT